VIHDLKPYPAMKDSGVPWLGTVPEQWSLLPNRALMRRRKVLVGARHSEYQLLSLTKVGVIVRDVESGKGKFSSDMGTSQEVRAGDLVFCLFDVPETPRTVGLSRHDGMITGAYTVFECFDPLVSAFLDLFYRAMDDRKLLGPLYSGLRNTIPPTRFLGIKTPLPPSTEQVAIVRFLDYADRRIRRYIRAKQKLIKLLEEQKQAIIHRAVTRGLNPNVRLKPSGVDWLGDVPEHWTLARLKDAAVVQTGLTLGKNYKGVKTESRPYLRVANVQVGHVDLKHVKFIDAPSCEAKGATLQAGDVLMTEGGDIDKLGRGCVWHDEIPGCLHQNHIFAVRCRKDVLIPEFLVGLMASRHGRAYFQLTAKQTTNLASTNSSTLRAFPIFLPPFPEQQMILDEVARETAGLAAAIGRAEGEIELLREYRTRLIADVVTGKLDVRAAAAKLPDETGEPESVDVDEALAEDEEETEDAELGAVSEEPEV
jgi:type I restriction enzyme S subunit